MFYPIISIFLECKEYTPSIKTALDSLLIQSFKHWEVFVLYEKNNTVLHSLVLQYQALDARIFPIQHSNTIITPEKLTKIARGEWITFLEAQNCFVQDAFALFFEKTFTHTGARAFISGAILEKNTPPPAIFQHAIPLSQPTESSYIDHVASFTYIISPLHFFYQNTVPLTGVFLHRSVLTATRWTPFLQQHIYNYDFLLHLSTQFPLLYIEDNFFYDNTHSLSTPTNYQQIFTETLLCMKLLHNNTFENILASHPTECVEQYKHTLDYMLTIALSHNSLFYNCGYNTLFIERIAEWLCSSSCAPYKQDLLHHTKERIQQLLIETPQFLQNTVAFLLSFDEHSHYTVNTEPLSVVLARSGGQLLQHNPSIAILFLNFYKELFPSIYSDMLFYFNEAYPLPLSSRTTIKRTIPAKTGETHTATVPKTLL